MSAIAEKFIDNYFKMKKTVKQIKYFQCKKCNTKILPDTNKKMISCKCGAMAIDGCEFYTRIIGNTKNINFVN